ncbi:MULTISPECIES: hypothetical protein [Clostridium]|uniref:hypothetical protein n=1 Tax=Clostridium TaxID=1485 RepID=UPI0004D7773E|nr:MULTISPECIES: hypothetical protein [Clostridium]KEH96143.1 hypothetical protein Z953_p0206 [Clostridium botulinum D str. 16868]KEI08135.1 hypothetical protein Z958_p0015 [Clostridium novyi B str. NCTC 9691]MCD3202855.1 hypothetical protein [Clostridium botulinum C/D]MCD3230858.1 hypothetical protein [Clostridium botulinum C/D]MCD3253957.1 hypothetical protein [Clostridium botulinum C/D]
MKSSGQFYIDGKILGNAESMKVDKVKNNYVDIKNNEIKGTLQFNCKFDKLLLLPNGYEVKRLLDIANYTRKIRVKKKLYKRAYELSGGLSLKVYK